MSNIEYLFIYNYIILFFFVNNIVVIYNKQYFKQINKFEIKLFKIYKIRNINELKWFLNICITRNRELYTITLCQDNYINKFVIKFNINITKKTFEISLNYISIIKNNKQVTLQSIHTFQQRIKFINFAIVIIRSNIIYTTSKLTKFFINSSNYYINQSNYTLKYLTNTKNYIIVFDKQSISSNIIFINSFNVLFANNKETR